MLLRFSPGFSARSKEPDSRTTRLPSLLRRRLEITSTCCAWRLNMWRSRDPDVTRTVGPVIWTWVYLARRESAEAVAGADQSVARRDTTGPIPGTSTRARTVGGIARLAHARARGRRMRPRLL